MSELTPLIDAHHGGFFMMDTDKKTNEAELNLIASYGFSSRKSLSNTYKIKESLVGQWIEVKSVPGQGSTFTLYLPVKYSGPEASLSQQSSEANIATENNAAIPALPEGVDFTGRKVLLMDDDIRNIFAINSILESRGMKVIHAENGKAGIKLLEENPDVDLVLMDTMMPEMDGLAATMEIRKNPKFKRLPIISLTAKAMKGDREKAIEAGASDYVTKPVDPEKLLSVMHIWIKKASRLNARAPKELMV